jgi:hypothetical protein
MKNMLGFAQVVLVVVIMMPRFVMAESSGSASEGNEPVNETFEKIENAINALRKAPDYDALVRTYDDLNSLRDKMRIPILHEQRRTGLILLLKALDALDQKVDPSFDPNKRPIIDNSFGFPPPPPQAVLERRERIEKYTEYYKFQSRILNYGRIWSSVVEKYTFNVCAIDRSLPEEINQLLDTNLSNKERREQLKIVLNTKCKLPPSPT